MRKIFPLSHEVFRNYYAHSADKILNLVYDLKFEKVSKSSFFKKLYNIKTPNYLKSKRYKSCNFKIFSFQTYISDVSCLCPGVGAVAMHVKKDDRVSLVGTDLVIVNVTQSDSGRYTCELDTNEENPLAVSHNLQILSKSSTIITKCP